LNAVRGESINGYDVEFKIHSKAPIMQNWMPCSIKNRDIQETINPVNFTECVETEIE